MPTCRRGALWLTWLPWAPWGASVQPQATLHGGGHALVCVGFVSLTIAVDYLTGPAIQFPILYLLPIGLASWYQGLRWGGGLALTMPWMRLCFGGAQPTVWSGPELVINAVIRLLTFFVFAYLIDRIARQHRGLQQDVRLLRGLLPICPFCKKIQNATNEWVALEQYISDHLEATFSHSLCNHCFQQHYPNYCQEMPPFLQAQRSLDGQSAGASC